MISPHILELHYDVMAGNWIHHCLPVFHFSWLYRLLRPPSNAPIPNYLSILTQDIMELVTLCLNSTYFQYNGKHYKQLHGTAMGSPVSVIVVEIVMQAFEERAIATYQQTPICLCYVDDTFTIVHQDEINTFHEHLNERQNPASHTVCQRDCRKWKASFSRLPGNPWQQQNTDSSLQKADTYWQTTWPIILQPYFAESYNHQDIDKTSTTSLWLTWQPIGRN